MSLKLLLGVLLAASPVSFAGSPLPNAFQTEDQIKVIREHYAQINKAAPRYRKVKKDLSGFSAEGGRLVAYFDGQAIAKIIATFYGETGRATEEYYYHEGKLIFVLRTDAHYDRPLSGKVIRTEANRFYFNDDKLIRWIDAEAKQVATDHVDYAGKQTEYLATSQKFTAGARSAKPSIEGEP